ncbi:carbohydrate kinase family protein [Paenibacillus hamazuiensis]|uniref:carbohydrate kinase family protein n=1 Tax=Paenibacillus hamazuiensis TaxID=2936508 RepID=UPI00200DAFF0|nr:carbohydrate kinase family protein [Paenibacillus hamazuiensis]
MRAANDCGHTVVVVGELNVDIIISGEDVVPEWNREKTIDQFQVVLGSSSAITACALSCLGLDVRFVSVVGGDDFGAFCKDELKRMGVNVEHVVSLNGVQTGVTLSFSTPSDRGLLTYPGSIPLLSPSYVPDTLLNEASHLHFGSYYLQDGMRAHWPQLFGKAHGLGISTSFDTGWDVRKMWDRQGIELLLAHTDLFIPSEEEILHIYDSAQLSEAFAKLPETACTVAVKQGSRGAALRKPDKKVLSAKPCRVTPVDTTGAGDCFNAGIIYGYLHGYADEQLLRFGNACGALSTQGVGGTGKLPTVQEAARLLAQD